MKISARASRIIASLLTIVLLLTTATFTAGWYEPSPVTALGEKTSDFLPSDTTAYFSFNLLPGQAQSTQFDNFLSFYRDAILEKVNELSHFAYDYLNDSNITEIVGPELAVAMYDISGNPGIVFFVQVPSDQTSQDIQDLVIYAMDTMLGGKQSETPVGGGVTEVNRLISSETKIEYYANAVVSGSGDRYVLGSIGNITLADFQILNTSVSNGAWATVSLSANVDFQDVQNKLPSARLGLGFINGSDLQNNAIGVSDAVGPYLTALEGLIPSFSMITEGLSILSSPSFDLIEPYIPSYAGMSISGIASGLQLDFYSPDDSLPLASGVSNLLSTAELVTSDAQMYFSDVNLNAWWQNLRPVFESNSSELHDLADALSDAGLDDYLGFDISILADLALDPNLDADVFNWSTGEFAVAQLPYAGGTGYLLVFSVSDYAQAVAKIGNLSTALGNIGISGVHSQFTAGNTFLIMGGPAGIIADMLTKPRLSANANFSSMEAMLLSPSRGLIYKDTGAPLLDIGASYYMGSVEGRIIFRVPSPGGGGSGGSGGSGEGSSVHVPVPPIVPIEPTQLFDITLTLDSNTINKSSDLTARMHFESFGTVPTPVDLTFIVLDESGQEVYQTIILNEIVVETELFYSKRFYDLNVPEGDYVLVARTLYNVNVSDEFRQNFSVIPTPVPSGGLGTGAWIGIGIAIVIALVILIYLILLKIYPPVKRESEKP